MAEAGYISIPENYSHEALTVSTPQPVHTISKHTTGDI